MELRRIIAAPDALRGASRLMGELGATAVVLPELEALRGVEQSRFHHRDVYGHTLEVLAADDRAGGERSPARRARPEMAELDSLIGAARASSWRRCWPSRSPTS